MPSSNQPTPLNLTRTASFLRNSINVLGVSLVLLMVGRVFFTSLLAYIKSISPPKQDPPTVGFNVLPAIPFPVQLDAPTSYKLETVGGKTPFISDRAKVFFMPSGQQSLKAVERAEAKALSLGYTPPLPKYR